MNGADTFLVSLQGQVVSKVIDAAFRMLGLTLRYLVLRTRPRRRSRVTA
jgi:hypothetical protein